MYLKLCCNCKTVRLFTLQASIIIWRGGDWRGCLNLFDIHGYALIVRLFFGILLTNTTFEGVYLWYTTFEGVYLWYTTN